MSQKKTSKIVKATASAALSSLLALSVAGCHSSNNVKCYGVAKKGQWIGMSEGKCKKLAGSKAEPIAPNSTIKVKKYSGDDYIKCYGVAAASMNDCATKTSACGGTAHTPRSKDAWIALPEGICQQVKGGIVVAPKKS